LLDNRLAGVGGGAKKSGFKLGKEFERALGIRRGLPDLAKGGNKTGRESNPKRNRGSVTAIGCVRRKRKEDRKVVGKRRVSGRRRGTKVGVVVENRNARRKNRIQSKRGGNKKPVQARGPGIGTRGRAGEVKIGVLVMGDIDNIKTFFEGVEKIEKRSRRKARRKAGGVVGGLDEVKVATEEGRKRRGHRKNIINKLSLKRKLIITSFKVNVEKLERLVERVGGSVSSKLDVALAAGRKGNVGGRVKAEDRWGIDNSGPCFIHAVVVARDGAVGERRESVTL
jgi:hypothetical protein